MRIATYNIWNKNYRYEERLPLIVKELKALQPDVITLQEVLRDEAGCSADEVARELGLEHVYYFPDKPKEPKSSGVAILSKYEANRQHFLRLSRNMHDEEDKGTKVFGAIELAVEDQPFFIGTTWLSVSTEAQRRTTREIAYFTDSILKDTNPVVILAGDLNNYTDEAISPLFTIGRHGLKDALAEQYKQNVPSTWPTNEQIFISSWQAKHPGETLSFTINSRRIDYLMASNIQEVHFTSVRLFGNTPAEDGILYPSDHMGVYAEIAIDKKL